MMLLESSVPSAAATGDIVVYAGIREPGSAGDGGQATAAQVLPIAIAGDFSGNTFIAHADGLAVPSIQSVRRIAANGVITTVAGGPDTTEGDTGSGDGGPASSAQFGVISDLATDPAGNVYVHDGYGSTTDVIRRFLPGGTIQKVAGLYFGETAANPTVSCRPPVGVQPLPPDTYQAVLKTDGTFVQTPLPVTVVVTPT